MQIHKLYFMYFLPDLIKNKQHIFYHHYSEDYFYTVHKLDYLYQPYQ